MARVILITGGCRSGKSGHAQALAESLGGRGRRVYVATGPVFDEEMRQRVDRHRAARAERNWETSEEMIDVAGVIEDAGRFDVVLVDCLTLWINNLMYRAQQAGAEVTEDEIADAAADLLESCREHPGTVIFVTNEVGMGIVPENASARRFRDLAGRCNQVIAAGADVVTLVTCGIPLTLKGA